MAVQPISDNAAIAVIRDAADRIAAAVSPEEIVLFGSQADGTARPQSDIDLLVIMPDAASVGSDRRKHFRNVYDALRGIEHPIDVLIYSRSEAEARRYDDAHPVGSALTTGKVLYLKPVGA